MGNKSTIKKSYSGETHFTASNIVSDEVRPHSKKEKPKTKKQKHDHKHIYERKLLLHPVVSLFTHKKLVEKYGEDYKEHIKESDIPENHKVYSVGRVCTICKIRYKHKYFTGVDKLKKFKDGYYVYDEADYWSERSTPRNAKYWIRIFTNQWGEKYFRKLNEETFEIEDIYPDLNEEIKLDKDLIKFLNGED